jgi:WD40 repeat protein/AAA+ ATPase superfamily predicted ATPase
LLFLPRLLGLDVPGHVTRLAVGAWPLAAFAAVWGLTLTRRPNPPIGLRLIVIGMLAGALMSIVLAYPAYGLIFNTFNLGVSYAGSAFHVVALLGGFVAVLIWLAAGPAAVLWIRPQSRGGRLLVGATAGVLAGGIAFGLLGAPLGGVWAQSPLYGFALSREGYESGEWVLKLALAVLNIFPISLGLMWVSVGGGAIVGGVTVWFTPGRARSAPAANAADVLYELATALGAPLILALSGVAAVVILYLLPQAIQNIFNAYGFLPRWPTTWLQPAFTIQYLLALIVFQGLGLIAVYRSYRPLAARASRATASLETTFYVLAFVGAALHLMLFSIAEAVYGNPIVLALALVNLGLGLEIVLAFRWARKNVTPPEAGPTDAPIPSGWTGAGMVAGLLVGMLLFQFIGLSLSLVLISTPIIAPLAELKAPPGVAWLEETLFEPLFTIAPIVLTVLALWSMGTGFSVNASNPIFFRPVWDPNAGILRAARQRFEAAWQRIPRLVLDVLAVALALILAWTTREALTVVVVSLLAALIVLHRRWERPPWAIAALAFVIVVLCVAGLTLGGVFTDARPARLMYLLLGPASVLALRALTAYVPEHQHTRTRLTAFVGLAVAVGVLSYANQARVIREGGVSRYDGQQWEAFDSTNSLLGVRLNYALHQDSHGRLWFGSGPIAITYDAQFDRWQRYLLRSVTGGESLTAFSDTSLESRLLFAEDRQGRLWVASGDTFGQLDPALTARTDYVREPGMFVAGPLLPTTSACGQGVIQIWDLNGNLQTLILDPEGRLITGADVSPDGAYVVAANGTRTAKVWDTRTGEVIVRLEGHTNLVNMATFSPDGTLIATASNDKTVKLWDAQTGNLIATMSNTVNVNRAVFNSDGTQILAAGDGLETPIWDVQTGERIAALEQSGTVKGARFSPDGTRVVTVNGTELAHLWDARTGQSIAELIPDWVSPGEVDMAEFSPDGNLIATAGPDEIARVWDARTGHLVMTFNGHTRKVTAIAFSPDGTQIATASLDGAARLWQANTGELLATFDDDAAGLYQVEFTADETQLVTCDRDNREQVWDVGTGQLLTTLPSHVKWLEVSGLTPDRQHILVAGCIPKGGYQTLSLNSSVTDMTLDNDGNLWLATAGEGVYRIDANRQLENMTWEHFSSSNIANLSDNIRSLYIDQTGNLWAVTDKGLNVFDGVGWGRPLGPTALSQSAEVTFVEDSAGQLWAGATGGLYQWDGEAWTAASEWPEGLDATTLIEDSAGNLWAGTAEGALLFDSVAWKEIVPDVAVTTIVEDPSGKMWVGAQSGLFRFDPATGKTDSFTFANSGLATDAIQGLLVDAEGEIWASTFTVERIPGSPWAGLAAAVLFFGYLTVQTYRSYDRAPESRARRLNRQIEESPNSLYLAVYALLANTPDAPHILTQLADHRAKADDAVSAEVIRAIVALTTEPRTSLAANLNRSVAALEADAARAGTLGHLHNLLAKCLVARLIADITGLELSVDPGPEAGSVALRARDVTVAGLPPFARTGMAEAWRTLEKVGTVLRKYQEVDTAADRLSFLAEALSAVEAAVTAAQAVKPPEGRVMSAIASQWRAIVDYEINLISGRAELRLELRTRQARRAEQITVALRLQNAGRATAENVTVTLLPGEGFTLDGDSRVTLDRLPSGRSQPVEFTICPAPVASARIACRVTWDDRMGADNEIQFADALRFYEVSESFKRIPNPYIVGHPVKSPEMFQGRADIFEFIRDNLSGPTQDRTIVLHGQRRTGKTSILYQLVLGKLGAGFLPVLIDMQEVALLINGAADFLNEVAYQLARAIRKAGLALEPPDEAAFAAAPTRTFSRFLDAVEDTLGERKAVLIFDEFELIEGKIAEGKLEADLLNYFRSLIQHRHRLVFIFTGTHRLEEMSHDYWSILFNLALYRRVSFLTPADVAKLIRQPVAGALDVDALAVEKIIALTRGHAYFTQLICWALVNHCNANERNYATLNDVNDALQEILASGEAHFAYIWQQADATERLALAAVAHTIRPGKDWARPAEILETLAEGGAQMSQAALVDVLDRLTRQDVLESASDGALRYRFQIEVLRLWVEATKSVTALVERGR